MSKKKNKAKDIKVEDVNTAEGVNVATENKEEANTSGTSQESEQTEEDRIAELEKQLADQKDKNLRLFADFENLRKRTAK